jgi:hypothetical protein
MNHPAEFVSIPAADVLKSVSVQTLAQALLERVSNGHALPQPANGLAEPPAIGAAYQGGIYAGLTVHDNAPAELILLSGDEELNWQDALAWAEKQGGTLPSRIDQLVLFKNLKSEFQEAYYWSSEQSAHNDAFAWIQSFTYGYQSYFHKSNFHRARAVRRLPIE